MDIIWEQLKSLDSSGMNAMCGALLVVITVLCMKLRGMMHPFGSFSTSILRPFIAGILTSDSYALLQALRHMIRANSLAVRVRVFVLPLQSISSSTSVGNHMKWYLFDSRMFCGLYANFGLEPPENPSVLKFFSQPVATEGEAQQQERAAKEDWHRCMEVLTARMLDLQQQGAHASDSECDTKPLDRFIGLMRMVWNVQQYRVSKAELLMEHRRDSNASNMLLQTASTKDPLGRNTKLMEKLGYYGSGLVEFKGSWYSCSRLHHLERWEFPKTPVLFNREVDGYFHSFTGPQRCDNYSRFRIPRELLAVGDEMSHEACARGDCLELFYSFRSPYSQLVLDRTLFLCAKYKKRLALRPMLPMIARNLAVPLSKVMYIAGDANREAKFWNFTFGCISDPSHSELKPVYRALTVYLLAARIGLHASFVKAFGLYVWGRGVDAGTDTGLRIITDGAGLDWAEVQAALRPEAMAEAEAEWRAITSANVAALGDHGHWGVPALKFRGECVVWGQDKLWVMDRYLAYARTGESSGGSKRDKGKKGSTELSDGFDENIIRIIKESGH